VLLSLIVVPEIILEGQNGAKWVLVDFFLFSSTIDENHCNNLKGINCSLRTHIRNNENHFAILA